MIEAVDNPCSDNLDIGLLAAGVGLGIFTPGGGYGSAAKYVARSMDDVLLDATRRQFVGTVGTYSEMKKLTRGHKGLIQSHQLLEGRLHRIGGLSQYKNIAVILDQASHSQITNRWLKQIGRRNMKVSVRSDNATKEQVIQAMREVYRDMPELLRELGL